jgi:hypothetical protein
MHQKDHLTLLAAYSFMMKGPNCDYNKLNEKFEETREVIRGDKWKKDNQYNVRPEHLRLSWSGN